MLIRHDFRFFENSQKKKLNKIIENFFDYPDKDLADPGKIEKYIESVIEWNIDFDEIRVDFDLITFLIKDKNSILIDHFLKLLIKISETKKSLFQSEIDDLHQLLRCLMEEINIFQLSDDNFIRILIIFGNFSDFFDSPYPQLLDQDVFRMILDREFLAPDDLEIKIWFIVKFAVNSDDLAMTSLFHLWRYCNSGVDSISAEALKAINDMIDISTDLYVFFHDSDKIKRILECITLNNYYIQKYSLLIVYKTFSVLDDALLSVLLKCINIGKTKPIMICFSIIEKFMSSGLFDILYQSLDVLPIFLRQSHKVQSQIISFYYRLALSSLNFSRYVNDEVIEYIINHFNDSKVQRFKCLFLLCYFIKNCYTKDPDQLKCIINAFDIDIFAICQDNKDKISFIQSVLK